MKVLRWFFFLWCCGYLLCAGCSLHSRRHDTAQRTEEKRTTWQTAETAALQTQSVETKKTAGTKQTRRWAPDGKLLEEVIEHWGSDGRVQVSADASASRSAARADFSDVRASSSSSKQADTRAGTISILWWVALVAAVAAGAWALRRWWRSLTLRLP